MMWCGVSVNIDYWNTSTWRRYFREDILPLYQASLSLFKLWGSLFEVANGKFLSDIIKDKPEAELIFVGGTSPPDKYEENSLAYVYSKLLGASVKLREYYFLRKLGKEPRTICNVVRTPIVVYLDHIFTLLERVVARACEQGLIAESELQKVRGEADRSAGEALSKPETLPELFTDFLNKAIALTIAYNEHTRFIWYLRKMAKKCIIESFPKLSEPGIFETISHILGLNEYIRPSVEDPEIADAYTIFSYDYARKYEYRYSSGIYIYYIDGVQLYSHHTIYLRGGLYGDESIPPYFTVGGCICRCNELIWGLFNRAELELIARGIPKPMADWVKLAESMVTTRPSKDVTLGRLDSYEALDILDEYLPSIFVGKYELIIDERGGLKLLSRW